MQNRVGARLIHMCAFVADVTHVRSRRRKRALRKGAITLPVFAERVDPQALERKVL